MFHANLGHYGDILREYFAEWGISEPWVQLRLISEVAEHLRMQYGPEVTSILELQGLGKEIWAGIDAQEYVDRERASWNG